MGPVDSAEKIVLSWTDALKREPLSLALVLMNLALLAFFYFLLMTVAAQREREIKLLYEDKAATRELLAKCVVPAPPQQRTETPDIQRTAGEE